MKHLYQRIRYIMKIEFTLLLFAIFLSIVRIHGGGSGKWNQQGSEGWNRNQQTSKYFPGRWNQQQIPEMIKRDPREWGQRGYEIRHHNGGKGVPTIDPNRGFDFLNMSIASKAIAALNKIFHEKTLNNVQTMITKFQLTCGGDEIVNTLVTKFKNDMQNGMQEMLTQMQKCFAGFKDLVVDPTIKTYVDHVEPNRCMTNKKQPMIQVLNCYMGISIQFAKIVNKMSSKMPNGLKLDETKINNFLDNFISKMTERYITPFNIAMSMGAIPQL